MQSVSISLRCQLCMFQLQSCCLKLFELVRFLYSDVRAFPTNPTMACLGLLPFVWQQADLSWLGGDVILDEVL